MITITEARTPGGNTRWDAVLSDGKNYNIACEGEPEEGTREHVKRSFCMYQKAVLGPDVLVEAEIIAD